MSDQSPPSKPKPGSLRDRIAAFEKPSQQTSSNAPPPPRPKPGNISWKPRQLSPPSSPPATGDISGSGSGPTSVSNTGATEGLKKFGGGMSASDAKESISKGGSLKERMAALQGKGGFGGAPPPIAPKPAAEKPKWKPPPQVVKAGSDDEDEAQPVAKKEEMIEGGEENVKSPDTTSSVKSGEESTAEAPEGTEEQQTGEPDPEEEERQRRAAIAARMARLGGARVGMGAPVFSRPMVPKKPETLKPEPKSPPPQAKEHVSTSEPVPEEGRRESLKSPPAVLEETTVPKEESKSTPATDEERKASTDSSSLLSSDSNATSLQPARPPTSMPLPAAPRRAGPPRRKAKSPVPEPEPEAEPASSSLAASEGETAVDAPKEESTKEEQEREVESSTQTQIRDSVDSGAVPHGGDVGEEIGHITPTHVEAAPESPDKVLSDDEPVAEEPEAAEATIPRKSVEEEKPEDTFEEREEVAEPEAEVHEQKESVSQPAVEEREAEEEEEDEDEETRRKRIADRVAKMGGFNPFSLPPQRKPSATSITEEMPTSPVSVSQRRTSGTSVRKEREGSVGSIEQPPQSPAAQSIRKSSVDLSSFPAPPARRSSQMSAKSIVTSPTSPPGRKPSIDSTRMEEDVRKHDDHPVSTSEHIVSPSGIVEETEPGTTEETHDEAGDDDNIPVPVHAHAAPLISRASISESITQNKATEKLEDDDTRPKDDHDAYEPVPRSASTSSPPPVNLSNRPPIRQTASNTDPIFVPPPPPKNAPLDEPSIISSLHSERAVPPLRSVPQSAPLDDEDDAEESAPLVPKRRSIPPPPRMIPQSPEEQEYTADADVDPEEEEPPVEESESPVAIPVPEPPRRLPPRPVQEDEGESSDSSMPLPHPHRRSIPILAPSQTSDVEDDASAKVIPPRRIVPPPPPPPPEQIDEQDDEEEFADARDEKEEILPTPPRRAFSPEQPSPQQEPLIVPPPPVPAAQTRPDSIAKRRSVPVRSISPADASIETESVQPILTPSLSVSDDSEVLDEDEGDPIDPSFHSPSRRGSTVQLQHQSPSSPSPPSLGVEPAASPEEPVEDEETARRRTIAERMAKLGGIRFGAAPIPTNRPPPPPKHTAEDEVQSEDVVEEAPSELTEEEEERARKERIAAKLASMGGMRIGMMPGMVPPRPPPVRKPSVPVESPISPASVTHKSPPPPNRAVPPPVPQSLSQSQEFDSEHESQATSDDGVKVEAEESEMEEVSYEDVEEEAPPPVPTREGRRVPSGDHPGRPMQPPPRPPVPTARKASTDTTTTRKSSTGSAHNYQQTFQKPQSDYVMVEEPETGEPVVAPPRVASRPPPARAPPPPGPPSAGLEPSDSQWEMPSAPTAESVPARTSRLPARAPPAPSGMDPAESQWEMPSIPSVDFGGNTDLSLSWNESDIPAPVKEPPAPSAPAANQVRSSEDLIAVWGRVGVQICEVATALHDKSKKALIGDGTYHGFVAATLKEVPNTAPVSPSSYGYLIYQQSGSSVQKRASEILPGDILWMQDAKLKGHKGIQTYNQSVGVGDPLVGIVNDFEAKKFKVRAFQANQHVGQQTVESVSYRLEDLKSGTVKVFRVLEA